jgi:3-dehydroquinate synthase
MKTININTTHGYDVVISGNLLDKAGDYIRKSVGGSKAALISDDIVYPLYGQQVEESLAAAGYSVIKYIIPNGENSKNIFNYISILNFLSENHMSRSDTAVALGGGVVGDLAGFAASTYLRGIHLIQMPTTLLAAVDSSVGGKTAINLDSGKNLAGTFSQPDLVLCDYSVFATLTQNTYRDGCAEIIKYGVISDKELFYKLYSPINNQLEAVISACISIKRDIVCNDEHDNGLRQILNFGHTIGHAVELCSNYKISHGSAVATGMAIIAGAGAALNICSEGCRDEIIDLLKQYKLPVKTIFSADELYNAALSDKKRTGDSINLIFPTEIGKCVIKKTSLDRFKEIIRIGTVGTIGTEGVP